MLYALMFNIFLLITLVILQVDYYVDNRQKKVKKRLKSVLAYSNKKMYLPFFKKQSRSLDTRNFIKIPDFLRGSKYLEHIQGSLIKAGIPLKAEEIIIISILLVIAFALIGTVWFKNTAGVALGALGLILPIAWISVTKQRRLALMESQLLDVIIMLANALRAGHSFMQALELVSRESELPLREEFVRITKEAKMGISIEVALTNCVSRVKIKDLELLITGVLIQRQIGGNLAEILDGIADTIDKRFKMRGKIKTLTAQGKFSAWIITLLPFALGGFIYTKYPEFAKTMMQEKIGILMLATGGIFMVVGIFIIRKIVNIHV